MEISEFHESLMRMREYAIKRAGERRATMRLLYLNVLLIMLYNGLRVNEARLCLKKWTITHKRVVKIPALKTKRRSYRKCFIPDEISDWELHVMTRLLPINDPERFRHRIKMFTLYNFGINPHKIRKLFIDYSLDMGYSPAEVAKILGLMKIRTLESYAHKRFIDRIRREHRRREKLKQLLEGVASEEE